MMTTTQQHMPLDAPPDGTRPPARRSSRRRRSRRGFTLLEMLIAISLMSLLFLGAMNLVIDSSRTTVRTQAQIFATGDAANSIQTVISQLREAQGFCLPTSQTAGVGEDGWVTPSGTTLEQFFSTTQNGNTVNSAVEITAPPSLKPSEVSYKGGISSIQVQRADGTALSLDGKGRTSLPYSNLTAGTAVILIYRGDPDGTPDPDPTDPTRSAVKNAGTYLWQYKMPADGSFNTALYPPKALCKSVSAAPNSVQFVRPSYGPSYALVAEPNQLEIKIISGYYSPINGTQTNEEGNGDASSQMVGKCVYMRDHLASAPPRKQTSQSSNNPFQHH